ncbi:MAG: NusG domain II-containing protein [Bacteroides sp.]|nr:NusG domain II-containing protein [Bacteroides sp.]
MKKKLLAVYIAAALLFAAGAVGTLLLLRPSGSDTVLVLRDEEVLYSLDLSSEQDRVIRLDYGGSYNLIEISGGRIRVSEAGCRDNTCVKTGWLSSSAPIVCLPNHLVIRFSTERGGTDAVAG